MYESEQQALAEEGVYKKQHQQASMPVTTKEQLGQELLKTFAKLADPDMIEYILVKKKFPVTEMRTVLDEKTNEEKEVEVLIGWEIKEIDVPIQVPAKYRELITDDIARAFLSNDDYDLYLDNGNYCETLKSFGQRYDLDLTKHHNHFVNITHLMVVGSGAVEGQRVTLAKTDIAKSVGKTETVQTLQDKAAKKERGFLDKLGKGI